LIIEDDVVLGQKLLVTFTRSGFITDYALDYQQGYQKIIRFEPDLVVMESIQTDGSGFVFCAELRKHFDISVIMLGTRSDEQTWEWIIKSGADHYEVKPCKHLPWLPGLNLSSIVGT
jgi:DNA-binding response OmpR family regulator